MCRLIETLRAENGIYERTVLHLERLNRSRKELFGLPPLASLNLPDPPSEIHYKCRVLYGPEILGVEFLPYTPRPIARLRLIEENSISYSYKYEDRSLLEDLFARRGDCDDILIVKNGLLTDSFAGNIVLEKDSRFVTPRSPLLKGTRREHLLRSGKITEADLRPADLRAYEKIHLINAMLDLGECTLPAEHCAG